MAKSVRFKDNDFGFKRAIRNFKLAERTFRVGISDPRVAKYAAIQEAKHHFMRAPFDEMTRAGGPKPELVAILKAAQTGESIEKEQRAWLRRFAATIKQRITELDLIDTGDMKASIKVLLKKRK